MGASDRLAGTLGAAGAGLLIALLGPAPALLANGAAFLLSGLVVALGIRVPQAERERPTSAPSYRAEFGAGWSVLRDDPLLRGLVVMIAVTNLFDQAYAIVLLPVWVKSAGLDVTWVGLFLAVFSGASIMGAAIAAAIGHRLPRLAVYTVGFLFAGPMPMAIFAVNAPVFLIVSVLAVSGFAAGFLNPIIGALLFERIPAAMVGRVIALFGALAWALMPFGGLYGGLMVDNFGIAVALGVTGMAYLLATLTPAAMPSFRQMGRKPLAQA